MLSAGRIEQVGSPIDLYHKPRNLFVAAFIGSQKMNFISGEEAQPFAAHSIGIRPEHMTPSRESGTWKGIIIVAEHLGADTFVRINVEGIGSMTTRVDGDLPIGHGDTVYLTRDVVRIHRFDEKGLAKR